MPRTAAQTAVIRDKRKTKIMMRTLRLFATKGFDDITIDAISNESSCSHGLVYHYFEKKEDIYNALTELQEEEFIESVFPKEKALAAGGLEGIKVVCNHYESVKNISKNHLLFAKFNLNRDYTTLTTTKPLAGESPLTTLKQLFSEAKENEQIKGEAEELAVALLDYLNGAISRLISEEGESKDTKLSAFLSFIL
ncbi:MAG: TetR/AcrR family transcriptional regulator [Enterococcus sp.]|nr:TetR/AcrR family transcriptional regulator [Enterococcus sp.]